MLFKLWCAACAAMIVLAPAAHAKKPVQPPPPPTTTAVIGTLAGYAQPSAGVQDELQGRVCNDSPNLSATKCTPIVYDNFNPNTTAGIASGVAALDAFLADQPTPVQVLAYSEGAVAASTWIAAHPEAVGDSFILIGNPSRTYGGVIPIDITGTQLHVIDLGRQYELWTDFPNNPSSPYYMLAVTNVLMGALTLHDYTQVNPDDPSIVSYQAGNVTYELLPTTLLPLAGGSQAMSDYLQPLVETAYVRPAYVNSDGSLWNPVTSQTTTTAAVAAPLVVSEPATTTTTLLPVKPRKPKPQTTTHKPANNAADVKKRDTANTDRKAARQTTKADRQTTKADRQTVRAAAKAERKAAKK